MTNTQINKGRKLLFMHWTGPLVEYEDGTLYIESLNPQVRTKWRMSRMEMLRFGARAMIAGLTHSSREWNREAATGQNKPSSGRG